MSVKDFVLKKLEENRGIPLSGESLANMLSVSRAAVWKAVHALQEAGYVRPDGMGPSARAAQCAAYSIGGQRQRRGCPSGVYYCQRHRGEPRRPADRQGRRTLIAPLQNFRTPLAKAAASGYVA